MNLEHVIEGCKINNFTNMIRNSMKGFGGLSNHDLATKVVCFGVNGAATFQGIKIGVATWLKEKSSPFSILLHCIVHITNLATLTFSNIPIVMKIETLLAGVYTYFSHNRKKNQNWLKLWKEKVSKNLCNIKTRWIRMVAPNKVVLEECKILLVIMT